MSNFEIYAQSIDDATLAYSATEDTGFPITNMQDRNIQTFFKDSTIAAATVNLVIDFGAARACDSIVLGNYIATAALRANLTLEAHSADAWVGAQTELFADQDIHTATLLDDQISFGSQSFRYWRLVFDDAIGGDLTDLQFGTIFLGTHWNWAHEPELTLLEESGHDVTINRAAGGSTYSQIANTTVRRKWNIPLEYIVAAEKTKHETFRDTIFPGDDLSRYPYYWSNDNGTTLYYSRYQGRLSLEQQAYQVWKANHVFVEEL